MSTQSLRSAARRTSSGTSLRMKTVKSDSAVRALIDGGSRVDGVQSGGRSCEDQTEQHGGDVNSAQHGILLGSRLKGASIATRCLIAT